MSRDDSVWRSLKDVLASRSRLGLSLCHNHLDIIPAPSQCALLRNVFGRAPGFDLAPLQKWTPASSTTEESRYSGGAGGLDTAEKKRQLAILEVPSR